MLYLEPKAPFKASERESEKLKDAAIIKGKFAFAFASCEMTFLILNADIRFYYLTAEEINIMLVSDVFLIRCSESTSDRYYMALYRKMLDPALKTSSKQPMFLNLLYKSMKKDISDRRVQVNQALYLNFLQLHVQLSLFLFRLKMDSTQYWGMSTHNVKNSKVFLTKTVKF